MKIETNLTPLLPLQLPDGLLLRTLNIPPCVDPLPDLKFRQMLFIVQIYPAVKDRLSHFSFILFAAGIGPYLHRRHLLELWHFNVCLKIHINGTLAVTPLCLPGLVPDAPYLICKLFQIRAALLFLRFLPLPGTTLLTGGAAGQTECRQYKCSHVYFPFRPHHDTASLIL